MAMIWHLPFCLCLYIQSPLYQHAFKFRTWFHIVWYDFHFTCSLVSTLFTFLHLFNSSIWVVYVHSNSFCVLSVSLILVFLLAIFILVYVWDFKLSVDEVTRLEVGFLYCIFLFKGSSESITMTFMFIVVWRWLMVNEETEST